MTGRQHGYTSLSEAILHAEERGPGFSVYRLYGTITYKICYSVNEVYEMPPKSTVVYRTQEGSPRHRIVINRGRWNEREA